MSNCHHVVGFFPDCITFVYPIKESIKVPRKKKHLKNSFSLLDAPSGQICRMDQSLSISDYVSWRGGTITVSAKHASAMRIMLVVLVRGRRNFSFYCTCMS